MTTLPVHLVPAFTDLLLSLADDKLMLGHANSDWTGLGPMLEEDIASSSIAQDEIAHAQALYEVAGELSGQRADDLAFGRAPDAYRCAAIVGFFVGTSASGERVPKHVVFATALHRQWCHVQAESNPRLVRLSKLLLQESRLFERFLIAWPPRD